jgi:hypothetical protein
MRVQRYKLEEYGHYDGEENYCGTSMELIKDEEGEYIKYTDFIEFINELPPSVSHLVHNILDDTKNRK